MALFSVLVSDVPDDELGHLLTQLSDAGYDHPLITRIDAHPPGQLSLPQPRRRPADPLEDSSDLPGRWELVGERSAMSYQWPKYKEAYDPYRMFRGRTAGEGVVHIGLGFTVRAGKWGRDRRYVVAFLSAGSPLTPLVELVEADDYLKTSEYISVVRGKDGGRKMFGPGDTLPAAYSEQFHTQLYSERVDFPGVWNKVVIVGREDDTATFLNHALLQARRRGDV